MNGFSKMVKLDAFTMKSQLPSYLSLILITLMYCFMEMDFTFLCITGAWFVALMSSYIFVIQEKNNLDLLYGSVSVSRKDIVLGRYVYIFLTYLISFIMITVVALGFMLYNGETLSAYNIAVAFSSSVFVFSAITGTQIPIYFKMGYTKAKMLALIPFIAIILLVMVVAVPSFVSALSWAAEFFQSNKSAVIIGGILLGFVIQYLSYRVSLAKYRK